MRKLKNNSKGITLVALIVTVIVLIILASVSINLVLGNHGILKMAKDARDKTEKAQIAEKIQLAEIAATANSNAEIDYDALVAELTNEFGTKGTDWDISDKTETPWEVTINGEKYVISSSVKTNGEVPKVSDANPGVLEGTGTEDDPYTINCIEDLVAFAYEVNNNGNLYEGKIVTLGCDLDFQSDNSYMNPEKPYTFNGKGYYEVPSGGTPIKTILTVSSSSPVGWAPIGIDTNDGFAGTFDGKNHTISNLYMKTFSYGGLFGKTNKTVTIKNLGIVDCNIISANEVGGILGYAEQNVTIVNCYCTGNVERVNTGVSTGGLLGHAQNDATIINCYNNCGISTHGKQAGGLVGCVSAGVLKVTNAFNSGNITSSNPNSNGKSIYDDGHDGGIVGYASGLNANNLYNKGNITSTCTNVGGIVGSGYRNSNISTLYKCYNSGNLFATHGTVGGIAGFTDNSDFLDCHNMGDIMSDPASTSSYSVELGEIFGLATNRSHLVNENCTYLNKSSNANSNGATGKDNMDDTMSLSNFVALMNSYVTENNNDSTKEKLNKWTLKDGVPVFAK